MTIYTRIEPTAPVEGGTGTKQSIARGFGGASATYDGASRLQKIMGDSMLAELAEAPVIVHACMQKVLVDGNQFKTEDGVQVLDDFFVAFHSAALWTIQSCSVGWR